MSNPYTGEVTAQINGRAVTLRATWNALAILRRVFGQDWTGRVAEALVTRDAADMAVMLEALSNGAVTVDELMASEVSLSVADAITQAFRFGYHGMKEPEVKGQNPTIAQPTSSNMLMRALCRLGLGR